MSLRALAYYDAEDLAFRDGRDPQCGYLTAEEATELGCVDMTQKQLAGLGAVATFNAEAVWADAKAGGAPYTPGTPESICLKPTSQQTQSEQASCPGILANANFRGGRATQAVREGLVELGYGEGITYGAAWTEANPGKQWKAFCAERGIALGPGLGLSLLGLQVMEAELKGEEPPVPLPPTKDDDQGDKPLPIKKPLPWGWIIAGGLGVAGITYAAVKYS